MFNRPSISDYFRAVIKEIANEVKSQSDSYILSVNQEEYAVYLLEKYGLQEIIFDDSREPTIEKIRKTQSIREFDEVYQREVLFVKLCLPVVPNDKAGEILDLLPSTFSLSPPEMSYRNHYIITEVPASEASVEKVIEEIKTEIERRNTNIRQESQSLKPRISEILANRKSKIENENLLLESIAKKVSIPLKQKTEVSAVVPTAVRYNERIKPIAPPKATPPTELVLERDKFYAILSLIDNSCRLFERTPDTFAKLQEEELRDVILSNLNGVFEGDAVGEAFSKKGKTDIYLKVSKGGVFIAECKYWGGPKIIDKVTNQILGYLTWRNSYGVVILFSKRKNFTDVINTLASEIPGLPFYVKGLEKVASTHYKAIHQLPEDERKLIEIHYLVYNLFNEG